MKDMKHRKYKEPTDWLEVFFDICFLALIMMLPATLYFLGQ